MSLASDGAVKMELTRVPMNQHGCRAGGLWASFIYIRTEQRTNFLPDAELIFIHRTCHRSFSSNLNYVNGDKQSQRGSRLGAASYPRGRLAVRLIATKEQTIEQGFRRMSQALN